jgi:membrane-bound lytic murein transglycosylase MltF
LSPQIRIFAFSSRPSSVLLAIVLLGISGCASKPQSPEPVASAPTPAPTQAALETTDADAKQTRVLALPKDFGRFTGDWDQIVKRGQLRVLVVYSRSNFFYDGGRQRGVVADAMDEFENVTNKRLKTGAKKFKVVYLPMPPGQLQKALNDGMGDIICTGVIITPDREKLVDFTLPIKKDVKLVVVTSRVEAPINSTDDLSGRDIYVNPISVAKTELESTNQRFKQAGKPEIGVKVVDPNLSEEDLLEMVNAGLIPATVSANFRAELWSKVYTNIVVTPAALTEEGQIGWAMRKGSPQLKAVMDDFIKGHGLGTLFGNMMVQRYRNNTNLLKNSTSEAEMDKFKGYVKYFQQYAAEYNFDYLMLAAQGYQESMLNQDRVSHRGAVGVMQVLPKYAAANPINIPNVRDAQNNIHAGAKMLAQIAMTYFNDPGIDRQNQTLFTFAAYNAGPTRIVGIRKQARSDGLDPNKWFGNVELIAAKDIGQETVQYVSNIYKYYVAYKMTLEQLKIREQAKQAVNVK